MSTDPSPPVLLSDAAWWGTLAAARELGRRGVPVVLASDRRGAPAAFSRHVRRVVRCPPTSDLEGFLEWLLAFGRQQPGHVLCATSDETAWSFARHHARLAPWFQLAPTAPASLLALLDKAKLMVAARAAGLDVPDTWLPASAEEAAALGSASPGPLFVKPRLQLLANGGRKGERADGPSGLAKAWRRQRVTDGRALGDDAAGSVAPIVQAYHRGTERIFTVDGFAGGPGVAFPALGCVKRVQRPRGSGPGLVFEEAPVPPRIAQGLARLFDSVGFRGPFDAEFLEDGELRLLIDVNPRFYNHMAFESERGLPLAWLTYALARGDESGLRGAAAAAEAALRAHGADGGRLYVHRGPLRAMRWIQALLGRLTAGERFRWDAWTRARGAVDPTWSDDDRAPARVAFLLELRHAARHPRGWLRGLAHAPLPEVTPLAEPRTALCETPTLRRQG